MTTPRDASYDEYLGEALKDPVEAAAYVEAVLELDDPAAIPAALRHVATAHGIAEVARRGFAPSHPGLTLRDDVLPALGLGVTQAAGQLGVSRATLSRILNGRAAISADMALRLEAWLGVERGGDARVWLAEQSAYDLWQAQQRFKTSPIRVKPAPAMTPSDSAVDSRLRELGITPWYAPNGETYGDDLVDKLREKQGI